MRARNPVDTGQAEFKGAVFIWQATVDAAQRRLDSMLGSLRAEGLSAQGELGDYRPLVALDAAARSFQPDFIVISRHTTRTTQHGCCTTWLPRLAGSTTSPSGTSPPILRKEP